MNLPLTIWDVSLVLAVEAVVLLVASELIPPHYGRIGLSLSEKRLGVAAIVVSILFLTMAAVRLISIIIGS